MGVGLARGSAARWRRLLRQAHLRGVAAAVRRGLHRQRDGARAPAARQRAAQLPAAVLSSGLVAVEWVKLGSYWMDPENTHKYDGHDLFNVFATVPVMEHLELSGRVTNLADKRFAETSSFTAQQGERFRPGAPRQFFLGAQYRFN